jgi:putative ABC transport system substrate-binding protein
MAHSRRGHSSDDCDIAPTYNAAFFDPSGARMRRRLFIGVLSGVVAGWPLAAHGQQEGKVPRIGYLSLAPGPSSRSEALRQGLRDLGYVENQNIAIDYRWAADNLDRLREAAAELVHLNVDVIVTGGPQATLVAKKTTATIPIVMAVDYDPVDAGFVGTLARPGGNITGLSAVNPELTGKRLQLLKETDPQVDHVAVFWNPEEPNAETFLKETQAAAPVIGVQLQSLEVRNQRDLQDAIETAKTAGANALIVLTDAITLYHRTELTDLAAKYHLPAIYTERLFVEAGGLMSYGANDRELHRHAALYVDKILKGAKPANLPVEQPTKFELVINLKTAKALGLTIPPSIMFRADDVIE